MSVHCLCPVTGHTCAALCAYESSRSFVMQLWSGAVHFPDFFAKRTQAWWEDQIRSFDKMLPLDGIWVDMNEPSNYCTGDVCFDPGKL